VELGADFFGSLVGQNTLCGLIVAVNKVTDDSEMLTERFWMIMINLPGRKDEFFESVHVITFDFEVTVIL
jgi:hypothetical protein